MVSAFRANRDFCVAALRALPGVTVPDPDGAFYVFPRIDGLDDSFEFCRRLLVERRWASPRARPSAPAARARSGSATRPSAAVLEAALERLETFLASG